MSLYLYSLKFLRGEKIVQKIKVNTVRDVKERMHDGRLMNYLSRKELKKKEGIDFCFSKV